MTPRRPLMTLGYYLEIWGGLTAPKREFFYVDVAPIASSRRVILMLS